MRGTVCSILWVLAMTLLGCQKSPDAMSGQRLGTADTDHQDFAKSPKTYSARGVIIELAADKCGAFIHHEEIPGFMDEMTMFLKVNDRNEYEKLKVGQQYTFNLIINHDHETYTKDFVATGHTPTLDRSPTLPSERWLAAPTFEIGDRVPEFTLSTASGNTITAKGLKGQVWAITFIFTRCPLPDYCPRMTLRFKEAMEILEENDSINWKLISLTIDPEFDQMNVLQNYKTTWDIESEKWLFCRTDTETLKQLGDPLGLSFQANEFPFEHNLRTAVFDAEGRLFEVFSGNNWTASELAESIERAAKRHVQANQET